MPRAETDGMISALGLLTFVNLSQHATVPGLSANRKLSGFHGRPVSAVAIWLNGLPSLRPAV